MAIAPHVHGRRRCAVGRHGSVSVVAERCAVADALTKVVLADADVGLALVRAYGARACAHTREGWRALDEPAREAFA